MEFQRTISIRAMNASSHSNDFMTDAKLPLPEPFSSVPGALGAMTRELIPASRMHMPLDLVILWGIGNFGSASQCSSYYDPSSPWYNVFYGAYAMRSYKGNGTAWGYTAQGQPNFDEFLQVAALDYNHFTAGQFGCPPNMMSFAVKGITAEPRNSGWDIADVTAQVPSGLHDPTKYAADFGNYLAFGIPDPSFLNGHSSYEPVPVRGRFYMRQLSGSPPITLVWGTACPDTSAGNTLLNTIIQALGKAYLPLGSSQK
jgi:hypothetical protein